MIKTMNCKEKTIKERYRSRLSDEVFLYFMRIILNLQHSGIENLPLENHFEEPLKSFLDLSVELMIDGQPKEISDLILNTEYDLILRRESLTKEMAFALCMVKELSGHIHYDEDYYKYILMTDNLWGNDVFEYASKTFYPNMPKEMKEKYHIYDLIGHLLPAPAMSTLKVPYQDVISEFVKTTQEVVGENLTGVYLHGSMAMGCFHPKKSDIDLIVVIKDSISDEQKMQFMRHVVRLNSRAPAKGLELSIVKREYCNPFVYPTPYELHFSPMHLKWFESDPQDYIKKMKGTDIDLAAHFSIIDHYGIALYGEEIGEVFGDVPKQDYLDSICADIRNAKKDIMEEPVYIILNLCRVLAYLREGLYLSKEAGGKWALEAGFLKAGSLSSLVYDALECYRSDRQMAPDEKAAEAFADKMMSLIFDG